MTTSKMATDNLAVIGKPVNQELSAVEYSGIPRDISGLSTGELPARSYIPSLTKFGTSAVSGLCLFGTTLDTKAVTFSWDPNPEKDIAGYRVYYGTSSRSYNTVVDAGNLTTASITTLTPGTRYYIAVTARNTAGLESGFSNEVQWYQPGVAPKAPTNVTAANAGGAYLTWRIPSDANFPDSSKLSTRIYYGPANTGLANRMIVAAPGSTGIVITGLRSGSSYVFYLKQCSVDGQESPASSRVALTVNNLGTRPPGVPVVPASTSVGVTSFTGLSQAALPPVAETEPTLKITSNDTGSIFLNVSGTPNQKVMIEGSEQLPPEWKPIATGVVQPNGEFIVKLDAGNQSPTMSYFRATTFAVPAGTRRREDTPSE